MNKWLGVLLLVVVIGFGLVFFLRSGAENATVRNTGGDPEVRIVEYLKEHVRPGQPVYVTDLHNKVFTSDEEREALKRLYDQVFLIPATAAQLYIDTGKIPTLQELSARFQFKAPGTLEVLLRVLEADPRVPQFFQRDPATGEITAIDVDRIRSEERFGKPLRN
jgi:hypothetical protein